MVRMKSIFAIAGLAKSLAEPLSSQREVAVALSPDDGASVVELIDEVEQGAKVSLVFDGLVFAQVPLEAVSELDVSESLNCMSRQAELSPAHSALAAAGRPSDGVRSVQADRLHAEGFTGKGVKVGILDLGFARYGALHNQGLVPAPVGGRVYRPCLFQREMPTLFRRQLDRVSHFNTLLPEGNCAHGCLEAWLDVGLTGSQSEQTFSD